MGQNVGVTDTARPSSGPGPGTDAAYRLTDRYHVEDGRVFLSGLQAIARLPVDQIRIDRRVGLSTAAFVSGYQGSPVGAFGEEVERARRTEPDLPIVNQPGVNEELAATSVMGSQLAVTLDDCRYDGVLGIWYGKGPGIDRAGDAIRHGVFAGTSEHGGVVAVVGDDPSAKSSTLPSSSDATMVDLHMPLLFPGDPHEAIELGRHAVALSRASGLWSGIKLVTPVADGTGTVDLRHDLVVPILPAVEVDGRPYRPNPDGRLITPYTLEREREFHEVRQEVARQYGALNRLNRVTVRSGDDWIGVAACGHTFHETREALRALGFETDDDLRAAGIRLFQLLMPIPLDRHDVREFAAGLDEIVVVEEKNPTLEVLVRDALYDVAERPRVWGKRDEAGHVLVPYDSLLDAPRIVPALRHHLSRRLADRLVPERPAATKQLIPVSAARAPFFCSGCPHNTSTRVEPGTLVGGGIGCHGMVALMDPARVGDIVSLTCMGGEGAQWIGIAPFVDRNHLIQNLGDGTFFHSGSLAVRAAVSAGIDITYKLLYNGTVAMTGGQDAQGASDVPSVAAMLRAEGVARIIITTDDPGRYHGVRLTPGVEVWDRSRFDEAQRVLAAVSGTTVLIHDQACAAEKRRARSRGRLDRPGFRVVINERICEGCGDCGDRSNCLSVQPIDTPYGRKTAIDQTSCNFDLSCLQGDCPAFATVSTTDEPAGSDRPTAPPDQAALPDPVPVVPVDECTIRLSGIGGTGVITVSQILGTAALFDGFEVRGLDQTGLSQKAGPVSSDLRISRGTVPETNHADAGGVDTYLVFDLLAGAGDKHLTGARAETTVVVGSLGIVPTGSMVVDPNHVSRPDPIALRERLDAVSRRELNRYLDTAATSRGLLGSTTTANIMLLGVAVQTGAVPISTESIERAIELNGVAVDQNVAAFRFGRRWVVAPDEVESAAGLTRGAPESLDELVDRLADDLIGYQGKRSARRFRDVVGRVRSVEEGLGGGAGRLTTTVARNLHKLMAYKDEYEVARLAGLDESRRRYEAVGGRRTAVTYHLHPPALRAIGVHRKLRLRRTAVPMFAVLRSMRRLRGTPFDPFGYAEVRRIERAMIPEYESAIEHLLAALDRRPDDDDLFEEVVAIAGLPDQVRGYEDLKLARAAAYRSELTERLAALG
ncbi:MAG: hypothetical protein RLZZ01_1588 [Actinomycetota bacterium]|jgi:indolepyruvate ferredoxin oxidoreductase